MKVLKNLRGNFMAGHSKWANIKHRKERADKKKGKIFSRIAKEIISSVKQGGPDPKSNSKLKAAIAKAKEANLPNENIERNIKKASTTGQQDYSEMSYELYGFEGVGIIVEAMTDNKNRLSSDMRIAINKCGGTISSPGSVTFNFDRKGVIKISKKEAIEDELFMLAGDLGAEDFKTDEETFIIITSVADFCKIKDALLAKHIKLQESNLEMIPKTLVECSEEAFDSNMTLIEWLENIDDVDAVFHNMKD